MNSNDNIEHIEQQEHCINNDQEEITAELIQEEVEMYTVDFNPSKLHVIYGGKNDLVEIYDYKDDFTVTRVEDFSDSIIYTKFISKDRFLAVSSNGTVALMEYDKEVCIIDIEEDLSTAIFTDKLVLGAVSGQVYLYDADLEHINTFGGHFSEIICVNIVEDRILSLSKNSLIAHDIYGRNLYSLKATEATAFKYIASDVICFARENKVQIFKENKKLFELKTDESVETIELVERNLVLGGFFDFIQLIDTTGHFATFKLNVNACVSLIKKYKDYEILFATLDGYMGKVDIRDINTLQYYEPKVGTVFDFTFQHEKVAVVGEFGFYLLDLINGCPVDL